MKKLNLLFVALIGASTLTFTSCTDECKDVVCENGGTCDEETGACDCPANFYGESCETECINGTYASGACTCDAGYEGDACGVVSREKFLSSYSVSEVCGSGSDSYSSSITASTTEITNILIGNFYNVYTNPVVATVSGNDITIASQDPDSDGFMVSGSGSINEAGTVLTITFTLSDGTNTETCTATYTKQ
jgi:hypothetical protein